MPNCTSTILFFIFSAAPPVSTRNEHRISRSSLLRRFRQNNRGGRIAQIRLQPADREHSRFVPTHSYRPFFHFAYLFPCVCMRRFPRRARPLRSLSAPFLSIPYSPFVLLSHSPSLPEQIGISAGGDGPVKRNKLSSGLYRKKYLGIKGASLIFVSGIKGIPSGRILRRENNIHRARHGSLISHIRSVASRKRRKRRATREENTQSDR